MGAYRSKVADAYIIKLDDSAKLKRAMKPEVPLFIGTSAKQKDILYDTPPNSLVRSKSSAMIIAEPIKSAKSGKTRSSKSSKKASAKQFGVKGSVEFPWLLKEAHFPITTPIKDFDMGRIIGKGFMGTVRIVKHLPTEKYLVFKAISKDTALSAKSERFVENEIRVLNTLVSSFCVKSFGHVQDRDNVYLALEYVPGGELFSRLEKKKFFPPEVAKFYIAEIFMAIEHVQSLGLVYRDLKPENVMLDEQGHCKLVDFGFARPVDKATGKLHTLCGTPCYLSPEQLDGKMTNGYTNIVDWWSFGVLLFELRTGKTPFCKTENDSNYEIFMRILSKRISFPWLMDKLTKNIISSLCAANPGNRLCEPEAIREHPYFDLPWDAVGDRRMRPPYVPRISSPGDTSHFKQRYDPRPNAEHMVNVHSAASKEARAKEIREKYHSA